MDRNEDIDETKKQGRISIIAALGKHRVLGKTGELLWRISDDLKHFKALTERHPVIMGRKTWESLPERARPLPGRANVVITRQAGYLAPGAEVAASLEEAIVLATVAPGGDEIFVIGGGEIYTHALPRTDRLYLTVIDDEKEGDAYFPPYENEFTKKISDEERESDGLKYHWVTLERP